MPTANHTTCQAAAAVLAAAASVEFLAVSDPEGSIHSRGPVVKVWADLPFQILHMLHGQHNKQCWVISGQQEADLAAQTAREGKR